MVDRESLEHALQSTLKLHTELMTSKDAPTELIRKTTAPPDTQVNSCVLEHVTGRQGSQVGCDSD